MGIASPLEPPDKDGCRLRWREKKEERIYGGARWAFNFRVGAITPLLWDFKEGNILLEFCESPESMMYSSSIGGLGFAQGSLDGDKSDLRAHPKVRRSKNTCIIRIAFSLFISREINIQLAE